MLDSLIQFYEKNGRSPIEEDFKNNNKYPNCQIYQKRFGGWNKALRLAELDNPPKLQYTEDELLNHLKIFYNKNKRPPVAAELINNYDYPGLPTYIRRFGSWYNALKLAGLDVDSMIQKGILQTTNQKGRYAETIVTKHFKNHPVDLAGSNHNSPCDGICPNGKIYDVKSSGRSRKGWEFGTANANREDIEIYYLLAFNEDYTELLHAWRIPGEMVDSDIFRVSMFRGKFNINNMVDYQITDELKLVLEETKIDIKR